MNLSSIPSGTQIFIDANIFLYEVFDDPDFGEVSYKFIKMVEGGSIKGFTSTLVLDEVLFKMLTMEASNKLGIPLKKAIDSLREDPEKFAALDMPWKNIEKIQNMPNLTILGISPVIFKDAVEISKANKLLPHDATHVAAAKTMDLRDIATSDRDFKRVDFLKVWTP